MAILFSGNQASNSVWQANVLSGFSCPHPGVTRENRENFIRAKYQHKLFLAAPIINSMGEELGSLEILVTACKCNDLSAAMYALAHGADINASFLVKFDSPIVSALLGLPLISKVVDSPLPNKNHDVMDRCEATNPGEFMCTALHVAARHGNIDVMVLLVMNGADMDDVAVPVLGEEDHSGRALNMISKFCTLAEVKSAFNEESHGVVATNFHHDPSTIGSDFRPDTFALRCFTPEDVALASGETAAAAYLRRKVDTKRRGGARAPLKRSANSKIDLASSDEANWASSRQLIGSKADHNPFDDVEKMDDLKYCDNDVVGGERD